MEWILYVGIAQALFVSGYVTSKSPRVSADYILTAWLIFLALPMITRITHTTYPDLIIPYLFDIRAFPLAFGPFLYLYAKSLIAPGFRWKAVKLIHFIPFLIFAVVQMKFPELFSFPEDGRLSPPPLIPRIHQLSILTSLIVYSIIVIVLLKRHRRQVPEYFSSITYRITLNWLLWITVGFIIAYSIPVFIKIMIRMFDLFPELREFRLHGHAFTFFIFVLGFFGLKQTPVYQKTDPGESKEQPFPSPVSVESNSTEDMAQPNPPPSSVSVESNSAEHTEEPTLLPPPVLVESNVKSPKYERSGLKEEHIQTYLERLEDYMRQSKPYLDANLNLESLARAINIPKHYITLILNKKLEKNFHQFINRYRLKNAIKQLQKKEKTQATILDIAYASGFNSKSTFNTLFKKHTQMTPSQFRKMHLKKEFDLSG